MSKKTLQQIADELPPEKALKDIAMVAKNIFTVLDEKARLEFVMNLIGNAKTDKVVSLVHLWLAECMGEGVDPTQMCQTLVDKVAQSRQLQAITDPELLVLFEDWFEELEEEILSLLEKQGPMSAGELARKAGLSQRGATFLLKKLKGEKKV